MINSKEFLNSLSPFWFIINSEGVVENCSDYFKDKLRYGEKFTSRYKLRKVYIKDCSQIIESLKGKIFRLENENEPPLRSTVHVQDEKAVIISWPMLSNIDSIQKFNISTEMNHPAAFITDIIIAKDMYRQNFKKLQEVEREKIYEGKLKEFSNIVSSTPSCFFILTSDGKFEFINEQGFEFLEVNTIEEANKVGYEKFICDEYLTIFKDFNSKICVGNKASLVFEMIGANGTRRWVETFSAPFSLASGEVGNVSISNDISERVLLERERENQKRINFHTSKLAAIGQLASGVGHEINNPLTIIKGNVEILKKQIDKDEIDLNRIQSSFKKIDSSIVRAVNIVKGLKSFARDDIQKMERIDITKLLKEIVNLLKDMYTSEGIFLKSDIEEDLSCEGSYGPLQQVVVNLLANAKDATNKKQAEISLTASKKNENIEVRVVDQGSGVPEDLIEKIFDPFFTTKSVNEGTGLGLSISHQIVSEHDGELYVEKSDSEGTSFLLKLKSGNCRAKKEYLEKQNNQKKDEENKSLNLNVLVVDDEEDILDILTFILEDFGCNVVTAMNGEEGLEALQKNEIKFDVLITDLQMPIMNGIELLKNIQKLNLNLSRLVISGGINLDIRHLEEEKLIDDFLSKPYQEEDLFKIISRYPKKS